MKEVKYKDNLVAIFHTRDEWKENLDFLTPNESFIQTGTWWYQRGKKLIPHKHILNERTNYYTQETIIVLNGKVQIDLYDDNGNIYHQEILQRNDLGIILAGGHGYLILEDNTKVVEVKNGPFISVEKDKVLIKNV